MMRTLTVALFLLLAGGPAASDNATCCAPVIRVAHAASSRRNAIVRVVEKARGSVVYVAVGKAIGTGVVVDAKGLIVTNEHVVGNAKKVQVMLLSGRELAGEVLACDSQRDLALIRVQAAEALPALKLPALELAADDDVLVGETVIAIGHPFGFAFSVSTGVIAGVDRTVEVSGKDDAMTGLLQTTAPINPGNSGGPLLNMDGDVVGINTAMRRDGQNIAFAIPAGVVREFLAKHAPKSPE